MNRPIWVLGAGLRIAVRIARSLRRRAIPADIGILTADEPILSSREVRNFVRLPQPHGTGAEFLKTLQDRIETQNYDVLIPCSDTTLAVCMRHYRELSGLLRSNFAGEVW
jgi:predicted ATP-grasp superfamily ATP-dependent carboligase